MLMFFKFALTQGFSHRHYESSISCCNLLSNYSADAYNIWNNYTLLPNTKFAGNETDVDKFEGCRSSFSQTWNTEISVRFK